MILECLDICKSFGENIILSDVSFRIERGEKAALVGANGAGKTTLLRIITGGIEADRGSVRLEKGSTLGCLAQYEDDGAGCKIFDEVLRGAGELLDMEERIRRMEEQMRSLSNEGIWQHLAEYDDLTDQFKRQGGHTFRSEAAGILKGLGFLESDFTRSLSELSGGERARVSLGRLLLTKPDIMLLDEPTNHLDIPSVAWLEGFLSGFSGAVLAVSHDRFFLDRVVGKVIEISAHRSTVYKGNYTDYAAKREAKREAQLRDYLKRQAEITRQKEIIDKLKSFNREKSVRRARSRERQLEKTEPAARPQREESAMRMAFGQVETSGRDVLKVEGLGKSYGDRELFCDLSFEIKRGERVALIGANGSGKSTILDIINGLQSADAGSVTWGSKVKIGYYQQNQSGIQAGRSLVDEIRDSCHDLTDTKIRTMLAAFLFAGDDVFKNTDELSGGERGRLAFVKLILSGANVLILDEPTNHLDIVSRDVLETALSAYEGTLIYVSHDRYFINRTATRILHLSNRKLTAYIGNYDYFLEKREGTDEEADVRKNMDTSASELEWIRGKEEQRERKKRENRAKKLEEEIEKCEEELKKIERRRADPSAAAAYEKLLELHDEESEIERRIERLYKEWGSCAED